MSNKELAEKFKVIKYVISDLQLSCPMISAT